MPDASFRSSTRIATLLAVVFLAGANPCFSDQPVKRMALLVAVTQYSEPIPSLIGPSNDVILWTNALKVKFGFTDAEIQILQDSRSADFQPTHDNILREMRKLVDAASAGDEVFVLFAGHGSQQPNDPQDTEDPDASDGFDEIFLPADVGRWDEKDIKKTNAIVDDEIDAWLKQLREKNAHVFLVFDACHSGTMTRGGEPATTRSISPTLIGIPVKPNSERKEASVQPQTEGTVVALMAAQPSEPTPEGIYDEATAGMQAGLLSWTATRILLTSSRPLSYRELTDAIYREYRIRGLPSPTPLLEGNGDLEILGVNEWPQRSRLSLVRVSKTEMEIPAGELEGIGVGTILAVYPPIDAEMPEKLVGYCRVISNTPVTARVVPTQFLGHTEVELPSGGRCEVVQQDLGNAGVLVGIHPSTDNGDHSLSEADRVLIADVLKTAETRKGTFLQFATDSKRADLLLQLKEDRSLQVVPGSAVPGASGLHYASHPLNEHAPDWINQIASRVAKVKNLLRLAAPVSPHSGEDAILQFGELAPELSISVSSSKDGPWSPWNRQPLKDGGFARFEVKNNGANELDVTLLYISSDYEIRSLIPPSRDPFALTRIPSRKVMASKVQECAYSPGVDHLVLIATPVRPNRPAQNYSWLQQESFQQARHIRLRMANGRGQDRLGDLLERTAFGGVQRATRDVEAADYRIDVLPCVIAPP